MTFSLLGRCARTGMIGAAVTTSSIAVGARVPFARAGVGAVLTQHRTDPALGPLGNELLARRHAAQDTLDALVAVTPHRGWRQLAVMDMAGGTASFTGADVIADRAGEAHGTACVAIANIVRTPEVPRAMVHAFEADPGRPLSERLLAALQAGEDAGGEFKPIASCALLVVHRAPFPYADLRVDRSEQPIGALAELWHAYAREADAYVIRALDPGSLPREK